VQKCRRPLLKIKEICRLPLMSSREKDIITSSAFIIHNHHCWIRVFIISEQDFLKKRKRLSEIGLNIKWIFFLCNSKNIDGGKNRPQKCRSFQRKLVSVWETCIICFGRVSFGYIFGNTLLIQGFYKSIQSVQIS
jgi:hypothetical protein